jgi:hypothetical protein
MIERILFVVGGPDTGKSVQLRSLFLDPRLGTGGRTPVASNVRDSYSLSIDRALYLRLTSPHETNETLAHFLSKTARNTRTGRWCVAAPLQPDRFKRMPEIINTIRAVLAELRPERVRVCVLSPDRRGVAQDPKKLQRLFRRLWRLGSVECHCIDARDRTANGTLLADFLDYS